jgi:hypothetical protein
VLRLPPRHTGRAPVPLGLPLPSRAGHAQERLLLRNLGDHGRASPGLRPLPRHGHRARQPPAQRGSRTTTFPHPHEPAQVRHVRPGKVVEPGSLRGSRSVTLSRQERPVLVCHALLGKVVEQRSLSGSPAVLPVPPRVLPGHCLGLRAGLLSCCLGVPPSHGPHAGEPLGLRAPPSHGPHVADPPRLRAAPGHRDYGQGSLGLRAPSTTHRGQLPLPGRGSPTPLQHRRLPERRHLA